MSNTRKWNVSIRTLSHKECASLENISKSQKPESMNRTGGEDESSFMEEIRANLAEWIPSGTVVKGPGQKIYMIEGEKKRSIEENTFKRLKYEQRDIIKLPDSILLNYEEEEVIDDKVFKQADLFPDYQLVCLKKKQVFYYIDGKCKRQVINRKALRKFQFTAAKALYVDEKFLSSFLTGEPIFPIISKKTILPNGLLFYYQNNYYCSENYQLILLPPKIVVKLNLKGKSAIELNQNEFISLPKGILLTQGKKE